MSIHLSTGGKLFLASVGLLGLTKVAEKFIEKGGGDSPPNTFGLPQEVYDELKGYTFIDDRRAYMEALNRIGAPQKMSFRIDLWKALGGK